MRRPWNIINCPIYSLSTQVDSGLNMNICTYVTAISMKPKMYTVAIGYKSKTYENLRSTDQAVLQILSQDNIKLIRPLGKKSGLKYDKANYLRKKDALQEWYGHSILKNISACLLLKKHRSENLNTDHELFHFTTEKFKTFHEGNVLMFQDLIDQKIIL